MPEAPNVPDTLATDLAAAAAFATPLLLALAALGAGRLAGAARPAWRLARAATLTTLPLALLSLAAALSARLVLPAAAGETFAGDWQLSQSLVLLLIAVIGVVITRYAATYLDGEPDQPRFAGWLLATLAGSTLVVATDHLAVLLVAWLATSLCLQNLLTFYGERVMAQMAAHKKFLVSRSADLCMLAAAALLGSHFDTLRISELGALVAAPGAASAAVHVAVTLVALAALLKSAQLPFHGWLMQVMEAPTPVSALLHAGVVNLGGFVLIRLGVLVTAVPAAQTLLVVVGSLTAALAALVATTRVSVKVGLAWSTCAQMGFMMLQCGLGLYEMALLHLLAHSIYKAHAFLSAGSTVQRSATARMAPATTPAGPVTRLLAAALAAAGLAGGAALLGADLAAAPNLLAMTLVVALAVTPMFGRVAGLPWPSVFGRAVAGTALVVAAWLALHELLRRAELTPAGAPAAWLAWWTAATFAALFAAHALLRVFAATRAVQRAQVWFHGGLFLDEWFTRLTMRLFGWRPGTKARAAALDAVRQGEGL